MKRVCIFIFLLSLTLAQAQVTPVPDEKTEQNGLTAQRTATKWGVVQTATGKIIAPPSFDLVVLSPFGFLGAANNQVNYYAPDGTLLIGASYKKLGFFWNNIRSGEVLIMMDDEIQAAAIIRSDSVRGPHLKLRGKYPWNGNQLNNLHCRLVEWNGKNLLVNNYDYDYTSDTSFAERALSGLYSPLTATWKIPAINNFILPLGNGFVASYTVATREYPTAFNYRRYDSLYRVSNVLADPVTHAVKPEDIPYLLPYKNITDVKVCNGPFAMGGLYAFTTGGKTGLFQLEFLRLVQPPVYDAVFAPSSSMYMFTVKGNKVGFIDPFSTGDVFEAKYDSVWAGNLRDTENTGLGLRLNGKWFVHSDYNTLTNVTDSVWSDNRANHAFVFVHNDIAVVEDVIPPFYSPDPIRIPRGNQTVDSLDANGNPVFPLATPGKYQSGMYDLKKQRWVVPRNFYKVGFTLNGYYGMNPSGNLDLFTLYDYTGKEVLSSFSSYMDITSSGIWSLLTGYEDAERTGRVECDTALTNHNLHNAVYVKTGGKTGVFDLHKMNWLIQPQYEKIVFLQKEEYFKAARRDTNGKNRQVILLKNGREKK